MTLDTKIEEALNHQINQEMAAAYSYLAASAWFDENNFDGFSKWMDLQRQEELEHAGKLIDYLHDRGGKLSLEAVQKPKAEFQSVMEVFESALRNEENNTRSIHALYKLSAEQDDYPTQSFLKWFIDEQVEEERTMNDAIGMLELAGDDRSALLVLNQQMGQRRPETD
ncbi:ferritin [Puniceicoccus vermicola]|uniref:Ferritin n=1 Tax=Puniceicoccus vermicola TaxID=388746 RepID=A0A7X1AU95_9BACT|nr:ferritin [Puniceicoccus vermicola]MBC2600161.1 ferritin [Puniceicoccus vermicola]